MKNFTSTTKSYYVLLLLILNSMLYGQNAIGVWKYDHPFSKKFFIENEGQCKPSHPKLNPNDIRFCSMFDGLNYYFTKNGIWITHPKRVRRNKEEVEELEKKMHGGKKKNEHENEEEEKLEKEALRWKSQEQFYFMEFTGSSAEVHIEGEEELTQRCHYGAAIQAKVYQKIRYHNLYPGIDMEIIFPEGKAGFKYNFVVQPGADPSQITVYYPFSNFPKLNNAGELHIGSAFGTFTEHAPQAMQGDKEIGCSFELKNGYSNFKIEKYDPSQSLLIDPWTVPPLFTNDNNAYDIDWDEAGNCYILGGGKRNQNFHEVLKLNSSGTLLWRYILEEFGDGTYNYGDFAVDRQTQSVYIISSAMFWGDQVLKLNSAGVKTASYYRDTIMTEFWRIAYNSCRQEILIGGGGTESPSHQAAYLDTNLVNLNSVNVLNTDECCHDVWGVALDNAGNGYLAFAGIVGTNPLNNILLKVPYPALNPSQWLVPTYYKFWESGSYVPVSPTAGYNGICISNNKLYTYDSYSLKRWDTANGMMMDSISVNTDTNQTKMYYGGLTADDCEHILVAFNNLIQLNDGTNHNLSTVYTAPDVVYDLSLGRNNILYACGKGFVSAIQLSLPVCSPLITTNQVTHANCDTFGSATLNVTGGVPPYTINWNTIPVQSGNAAINLPPGIYIASISDLSCPKKIKTDTITIYGSSTLSLVTSAVSIPCNGGTGGVKVSVANGTPPYTYSWGPIAGNDSVLKNIPAGTYTVTVKDKNGCAKTASITLNNTGSLPVVMISATHIKCNGSATGSLTASVTGGTLPYTYLWNPGGSGNAILNNLKAGTYQLTVITADGCRVTDSAQLSEPLPIELIITTTDERCGNAEGTAKVTSSGGVPSYIYLWSNGNMSENISKLKEGSYMVSVKDQNGCTKTGSAVIKNNADYGPKAAFTSNPVITDVFNPWIQFYDKSIGAKKWFWNFGDGTTDAIPNPGHSYKESGTFIVSLEITNAFGCRSIISDTVTIRPFWSFYIPNSFTPDGDGNNDTFNGKGEGLQEYEMMIFNRWGEQIFTTNSLSVSWDGKAAKGDEIVQQDVYLYLVILKDSKGKEHRYTGIVSLVK